MEAAEEIAKLLGEQGEVLEREMARHDGFRAGLLKAKQITEAHMGTIADKTVEGEEFDTEQHALLRKHFMVAADLIQRQFDSVQGNLPVIQGQIQGVTRALKLVINYHKQKEAVAVAREAAPPLAEKAAKADETKERFGKPNGKAKPRATSKRAKKTATEESAEEPSAPSNGTKIDAARRVLAERRRAE